MSSATPDLREYDAKAASTDTLGRVMCSVRDHHIIVDGPVQNGFPGEEITPAELFLAAVAACGVELVQMLAAQQEVPLQTISVDIHGMMDRGNPARTDYTVFNRVEARFRLTGVTDEQGNTLVESFKRR
jgi:uncharacterized OsmC-like protein